MTNDSNKQVCGDFIPFGFQYYRAPTPTPDKWERDLQKMAADGYNTVKFWIQWRWNHPEPNRYDFSDIDKLMDIAAQYSLKVILNIILDVAPVWLEEEYPDVAMITNRGEKLYGFATECRQIGGVPGPCLHHGAATRIRMDFVEACAKRYCNHPALYIWDVWNEPELTVGLRREPHVEDLVCYCSHSITAFRGWLQKKYGSIDKLNKVWGRNYRKFGDVEPSRRWGTTMDMVDWRLFFCDTVTEDMRLRAKAVKKHDSVHPVMCHTVPPPLFNSVTCGSDDFALSRIGDLVGNSVGSSALAAGILQSAAKGKPIINSEIHAVPGNTLNGFHRPTLTDMLRHIFIPLGVGVRGFVFWQYSPEKLGQEAPAWGNLDLKGRSTPWDEIVQNIVRFLKKEQDALTASVAPVHPQVGIFIDAACETEAWNAGFGTDLYNDSLLGTFKMFRASGYDVGFFSRAEIESGEISDFKVLYFPSALCLDKGTVQKIAAFAENGGTAVFEAYAGMIDTDTGMHCEDLPGCGLAELGGLHVREMHATTRIENGYDNILHNTAGSHLLPFTYKGAKLSGAKYLLTYDADEGTQAVAHFDSGVPVVYVRQVGNGSIVNITTLLGYGSNRDGDAHPETLLYDVCGLPAQKWKCDLPYGLCADNVSGTDLWVVYSESDSALTFTLPWRTRDEFGTATAAKDGYTLPPHGIAVLRKLE